MNGDYLNKVELKLPSPHEAWGKPCARGKPKVLFITSLIGAPRDIVELAQRFDMDWTVFIYLGNTFQPKSIIGGDDEYFSLVEGTSSEAKTQELLAKLDERPQVIVLGNIDPLKLPAECQSKLFHAVVEGAGLVRISYGTGAAFTVPPILFRELDRKRSDARLNRRGHRISCRRDHQNRCLSAFPTVGSAILPYVPGVPKMDNRKADANRTAFCEKHQRWQIRGRANHRILV